MLALQKAKAWQEKHSPHPFDKVLVWYLRNGVVWNQPDAFMLAIEAHWDEDTEQIISGREPNAWFVELAATSGKCRSVLAEMLRVAPHPHQWAVWHRRNEPRLRAFDWNKLLRKAGLN